MASSKTKRRSRKARAARAIAVPGGAGPAAPGTHQSPGPSGERVTPKVSPQARAAAPSTRRAQREARELEASRTSALASRTLGTYGERPKSFFDPIPVSEIAILAGVIAVVVGLLEGGGPAVAVGGIVCGLGVAEFTAREHFSGYRSHATLLAAFPAIVVELLLATYVGVPTKRTLLLAPVLPIFAFSFWLLRRAFAKARYARVARPPAP